MYTLYKDLSEEDKVKEMKQFDEKHHSNVKKGLLCVLCGYAIHICVCSHED